MVGAGDLVLRVNPAPDGDAEELTELTRRLRSELLSLDVQSVEPLIVDGTPENAKGVEEMTGWLTVHLGLEGLRALLAKVVEWALRNDRTVEVSVGSDVLKLGRATREQQEKIIDAWLARHPPSP